MALANKDYFLPQIENESHMAKVMAQADAEYYLAQKTAEANKVYTCTCTFYIILLTNVQNILIDEISRPIDPCEIPAIKWFCLLQW